MSGMKDMLGDEPYPFGPGYQHGSSTSKAAADSVRRHLGPMHAKIVAFLNERGTYGATYDEIVIGTGLSVPSVCGRMVELVKGEKVKKSQRTRLTASKRKATVYLLSEVPDAFTDPPRP